MVRAVGDGGSSVVERPAVHSRRQILAGTAAWLAADRRAWAAAASHCSRELISDPNDPWSYRDRGDRCEGTFTHTIANSFDLLGLTHEALTFEIARQESLILGWPLLPRGIHLQARSTPWPTDDRSRRVYYQMDAIRPRTETQFVWKLDVLRHLKVRDDSLGLVGLTDLPVNGRNQQVYVPLGKPNSGTSGAGHYRATFIPSRQMVAVTMTVSKERPGGTRRGDPVPLKQKAFFPLQPFEVSLTLKEPGIYEVSLDEDLGTSAKKKDRHPDGGASPSELLTFLLLHGPP